jgi:MSHA biogenesis protein MshQ
MMRLIFSILLLCASALAQADTAVALSQTYTGKLNFTGTHASMRTHNDQSHPCWVDSSATTQSGEIDGIPATATIVSARLYWAGSRSTQDYTITFNGVSKTAAAANQYTALDHVGLSYFSGSVDVTAEVTAQRNATYTFSGLTINGGSPYCDVETVYGGFQLVVIYSDPGEQVRTLNLYEGFQYIRNNGMTMNLSGIAIPSPLGSSTARIGHLSWGGSSLIDGSENFKLNNVSHTDGQNHSGDLFSSKSNIGAAGNVYGMDFDIFTSTSLTAGATSASARIETGNDGVFVSALLVAVPQLSADLAITKTLNNALVMGQNATYTLSVSNLGPAAEPGSITVTDTLPTGQTFVSATGTGWSCSASGQIITCTRTGALAANVATGAITVTVSVTATGSMTNTAVVDGNAYDSVPGNSTASVTSVATGVTVTGYVFTNGICTPGIAIGSVGQCAAYPWGDRTAGSNIDNIYITAVNGALPAVLSASVDTPVSFQFAISCHNPEVGSSVNARFGVSGTLQTLAACATSGAAPSVWSSAVNLSFGANKATATSGRVLVYDDVGQIRFYMKPASLAVEGGPVFTSNPDRLLLTAITAAAANPGTTTASGVVFAKAGANFTLTVGSYNVNGELTPNFGREIPTGSPLVSEHFEIDHGVLAIPGSVVAAGALDIVSATAIIGGKSDVTLNWSEVGSLTLKALLGRSPTIYTVATAPVETIVGRFIPDHFDTVTTGPMACLSTMNCAPLTTAAYSGQPFGVEVTARNLSGGVTTNYNGTLAKTVTLSAFNAAGGGVANPNGSVTPPPMTNNSIAPAAFASGVSNAVPPAPAYRLLNIYATAAPHANNWTVPTSIYIRATEAAGGDSVTSLRVANTVEGGLRIVNGRLRIANAHGSERLNLTLGLTAQYYTGAVWVTSSNDNSSTVSTVDVAGVNPLLITNLRGNLVVGDVRQTAAARIVRTLVAGIASTQLEAPGRTGSADAQLNNPAWLPSTVGRIHYGIYRSPLLYVREAF